MVKKKNKKKVSKSKITQYAVLLILSECSEPKNFDTIYTYTGFERKKIVTALSTLLNRRFVKKIIIDGTSHYSIMKAGLNVLKYYKENREYHNFWKPPWEEIN